jgi:hypothetical protein
MPFYVVMARLVRATHDLRRAGAHRAATGLSADPVSVDGPAKPGHDDLEGGISLTADRFTLGPRLFLAGRGHHEPAGAQLIEHAPLRQQRP